MVNQCWNDIDFWLLCKIKQCQKEENLGGEEKKKRGLGSGEQEKGDRDGLTIRAQRAHFTHTSSKTMEFALVAVERVKRERGERDRDEGKGKEVMGVEENGGGG